MRKMAKYLFASILFLCNNEIISLIALWVIMIMFFADIFAARIEGR